MNAKQFVSLLVLLVVLGGAGTYFLWQQDQEIEQSESAIGNKVFADFPLNEIVSVTVKEGAGEVTLVKDQVWTVQTRWNYPANYDTIGHLLQTVWDLKVVRPIPAGPSQFGRLELLPPSEEEKTGTLISFGLKDKPEATTLMLGGTYLGQNPAASPFEDSSVEGRYVMPDGDGQRIALVSETFSSVSALPTIWLYKDFFRVEKVKSIRVEHADPRESWYLSREKESGELILEGIGENEELDPSRPYDNVLSYPRFNDIADPEIHGEDTSLANATKVTLETFDGFTYRMAIGMAEVTGDHPFKVTVSADLPTERQAPEDESEEDKERLGKEFEERNETLKTKLETEQKFNDWVYLVPNPTVNDLLQLRSDLVQEKEEETADEGLDPTTDSATETTSSQATASEITVSSEADEQADKELETLIKEVIDPLPEP